MDKANLDKALVAQRQRQIIFARLDYLFRHAWHFNRPGTRLRHRQVPSHLIARDPRPAVPFSHARSVTYVI